MNLHRLHACAIGKVRHRVTGRPSLSKYTHFISDREPNICIVVQDPSAEIL